MTETPTVGSANSLGRAADRTRCYRGEDEQDGCRTGPLVRHPLKCGTIAPTSAGGDGDRAMKVVPVQTVAAILGPDPHPLELEYHLLARLFGKTSGAFCGRWDEARGEGVWFHSPDTKAIFEAPAVEEVIFRETVRSRFRSIVF